MTKHNAERAKKHLERIRRIIAQNPSPIFKMTKEETINSLRKTRESIWKEKIASRY